MKFKLVSQSDLTPQDDQRIRDLLVLAFPQFEDVFSKASYYYAKPDYRLWLEDNTGNMLAHLDFEHRVIGVGDDNVLIAGVGEVATLPDYHKKGLGRALMTRFQQIIREQLPADYGFLQCRPAVVGFYERVGWRRIDPTHKITELDINTQEYVVTEGAALILEGTKHFTDFPQHPHVHLRGLPW